MHNGEVHESRRTLLIAFQTSFIIVTAIIIALRFYSRAVIIRSVGLDDWLILFSFVSLL
jgi:hypothetical protein